MCIGSEETMCQDLPPALQCIKAVAEQVWEHWTPGQDTGERWGEEDCGGPPAEPHPMAELWSFPEGRHFRRSVTHVVVEDYSAALRTYDPCDFQGVVVDTDHPYGQTLEASQPPRLLLPQDHPYRLVTVSHAVPDSYGQLARVQQQIAALGQEREVCVQSLDEDGQERIKSLTLKFATLYAASAHWQAQWQQQQELDEQLAQVRRQSAHCAYLADRALAAQECDKATALAAEHRALQEEFTSLRQQRERYGTPQEVTVVIGVGGMSQKDRTAWRQYVKLEPDASETHGPRRLWSTWVRTSPWRQLFDDGWQLLWLPARPVKRERGIDDIRAHFLIYLSQAQMVEREVVVPWLQGYIQRVCGTVAQTDVDYVLEVVLKEFGLPMHANSLRAYIKDTLAQQQRQGGPDKRLLRGMEASAGEHDERHEVHNPSRRRPTQQRTALAVRDAVRQLGASPHTVRRKIREGKIDATKKGKYWQLSPATVDAEEQKRSRHALRNELIRLRVRWRSGGRAALEVEDAAHQAWDAARKWLKDQRKKQKTPGAVFARIAAAPNIQKLLQQEPKILNHARALLAQLGPDVMWE